MKKTANTARIACRIGINGQKQKLRKSTEKRLVRTELIAKYGDGKIVTDIVNQTYW